MNFFVAGPASAKDPNGRNPRRLPCSFRQGTMNDPAGKIEFSRARPMASYSASLLAFRSSLLTPHSSLSGGRAQRTRCRGNSEGASRTRRPARPRKGTGNATEDGIFAEIRTNLQNRRRSPCPCSTEFPGRTESNNKLGKIGTSPVARPRNKDFPPFETPSGDIRIRDAERTEPGRLDNEKNRGAQVSPMFSSGWR